MSSLASARHAHLDLNTRLSIILAKNPSVPNKPSQTPRPVRLDLSSFCISDLNSCHEHTTPAIPFDSDSEIYATYGSVLTDFKAGGLTTQRAPTFPTFNDTSTGTRLSSSSPILRLKRLTQELSVAQTWAPWLFITPSPSPSPTSPPLSTFHAYIEGPPLTPYAGGIFTLLLQFPSTYPFEPPTITFLTRIYHPCVNPVTGECCVTQRIKEGWTEAWTMVGVVSLVGEMISDFGCGEGETLYGRDRADGNEEKGNGEAQKMVKEDKRGFEAKAMEWTREFATGDEMGITDDNVFVGASDIETEEDLSSEGTMR